MGGTARIVTLVLLSPSAGAVVQREQLCAETLTAGHWGPTPVDFGGVVPAWPQGLSTAAAKGIRGHPGARSDPLLGSRSINKHIPAPRMSGSLCASPCRVCGAGSPLQGGFSNVLPSGEPTPGPL